MFYIFVRSLINEIIISVQFGLSKSAAGMFM